MSSCPEPTLSSGAYLLGVGLSYRVGRLVSYEEVLDIVAHTHSASADNARDITWLTDSEVIGIARDQSGRLEVFLAGDELHPRSTTVKDALEHHEWHRATGASLAANRLLLPAFGHFDQVCAFIAAELLRSGADNDLAGAFSSTEPIVELAIKRLLLSESALIGLLGELLLLDAMCRQAEDHLVGQIVNSWQGWHHSARDFVWDATGVEVKTTSRATSSHEVQGIHQLEPAGIDDGGDEQRLVLVSIGLQPSEPSSNAFTVPMLVQRILERMEATGNGALVANFLTNVAVYGTESGLGYDHATMSTDAPFTTAFSAAFVRGYDMSDPAIEVLRRDDVAVHHHVDLQSVTFRVNLPASVSAQNPVAGTNQVARDILG